MIYIKLFFNFFYVGLFAIGGGLATLPFLYNMAENTACFTKNDVVDMLAVSESTPGAIGVNMATFAGYKAAGILGGIIATFGLVLPSIIIIIIVAKLLAKFRDNKYVDYAFYGLRPASFGLIFAASLGVMKSVFIGNEFLGIRETLSSHYKELIFFVILIYISNCVDIIKKQHPIVLITISIVVGIIFF